MVTESLAAALLCLATFASAARAGDALVCIDQGKLVVEREDGSERAAYEPAPAGTVAAVARAGKSLAVVTDEDELLVRRGQTFADLGKLEQKGGSGLFRATSDAAGAHFFLSGGEDAQVVGKLDLSPAGKLSFRKDTKDAARVAPKALGAIDEPAKWEALRAKLKGQIPQGVAPEDALVWAEPSPWGGALVAVASGETEGETPAAELWYVPDAGAPVALRYQDKPLGFRGLLAYLPGGALALDGKFSAAGKGTLLLHKDGKVSAVPGVDGLCVAKP